MLFDANLVNGFDQMFTKFFNGNIYFIQYITNVYYNISSFELV